MKRKDMRTNNSEIANAFAGSGTIFHCDTISAAVFTLSLENAKGHGVYCGLELQMLVRLQLLIISRPCNRRGWLA